MFQFLYNQTLPKSVRFSALAPPGDVSLFQPIIINTWHPSMNTIKTVQAALSSASATNINRISSFSSPTWTRFTPRSSRLSFSLINLSSTTRILLIFLKRPAPPSRLQFFVISKHLATSSNINSLLSLFSHSQQQVALTNLVLSAPLPTWAHFSLLSLTAYHQGLTRLRTNVSLKHYSSVFNNSSRVFIHYSLPHYPNNLYFLQPLSIYVDTFPTSLRLIYINPTYLKSERTPFLL